MLKTLNLTKISVTKKAKSNTKTIIFYLIMVVCTLGSIEAIGRVFYRLYWGETFPELNVTHEIQDPISNVPAWLTPQIIHPYSGTGLYGGLWAQNRAKNVEIPNTIVVGLFGGSVAFGLREELEIAIQSYLKDDGVKKDLQLEVYAAPGFKQPQQLMQLIFALSIGKHFDLVINLDGYNEAVLSIGDNFNRGVNPFFPRYWDVRLQLLGARHAENKEKGKLLRDRYLSILDLQKDHWLNFSSLFGFVVKVILKSAENEIALLNHEVQQSQRKEGIEFTGPVISNVNGYGVARQIANNWMQSSIIINQMKQLYGFEYFHFLQPNQYLPMTKSFTEHKKNTALNLNGMNVNLVRKIYPLLQLRSKKLMDGGINFYDLTTVYKNVSDTIYIDKCCHVNNEGNKIIAAAMISRIGEKY